MNAEEHRIRRQLDLWFAGWSPGNKPFDAEVLRPLFAEGRIHVVDDFGNEVVTINDFDNYADTWGPVMADFAEWSIRPHSHPAVQVSGDLAAVTFTVLGQGRTKDGVPAAAAQHGTQIWRKRKDRWVIVHEHLTSDNTAKFGG